MAAGNPGDGLETSGQPDPERDRIADDQDRTSPVVDTAAEARDERAEARDLTVTRHDAGAASDRAEAASDRSEAAADRAAASLDRFASARERAVSSIDGLTGAHSRDAGLVELERETARAKRTGEPFLLAFVDVDYLKATNDSRGHAAGDQLLYQVADTIRANLRPYDLIVRFGGDEFVCGLLNVKLDEAAKRFMCVNANLAERQGASVTVGLAELEKDDSLQDLIARADAALYEERQQRPAAGPIS